MVHFPFDFDEQQFIFGVARIAAKVQSVDDRFAKLAVTNSVPGIRSSTEGFFRDACHLYVPFLKTGEFPDGVGASSGVQLVPTFYRNITANLDEFQPSGCQ